MPVMTRRLSPSANHGMESHLQHPCSPPSARLSLSVDAHAGSTALILYKLSGEETISTDRFRRMFMHQLALKIRKPWVMWTLEREQFIHYFLKYTSGDIFKGKLPWWNIWEVSLFYFFHILFACLLINIWPSYTRTCHFHFFKSPQLGSKVEFIYHLKKKQRLKLQNIQFSYFYFQRIPV